mmetsp:Transcript_14795/g.43615  ORF Transcript_14795/g.43615 Transcript_14795/m.43615 type:complete len:239 (-) Transcript_14795:881-1597(-)
MTARALGGRLATQRLKALPVREVPHADHPIVAAREQPAARLVETHACHLGAVRSVEAEGEASVAEVPHADPTRLVARHHLGKVDVVERRDHRRVVPRRRGAHRRLNQRPGARRCRRGEELTASLIKGEGGESVLGAVDTVVVDRLQASLHPQVPEFGHLVHRARDEQVLLMMVEHLAHRGVVAGEGAKGPVGASVRVPEGDEPLDPAGSKQAVRGRPVKAVNALARVGGGAATPLQLD